MFWKSASTFERYFHDFKKNVYKKIEKNVAMVLKGNGRTKQNYKNVIGWGLAFPTHRVIEGYVRVYDHSKT